DPGPYHGHWIEEDRGPPTFAARPGAIPHPRDQSGRNQQQPPRREYRGDQNDRRRNRILARHAVVPEVRLAGAHVVNGEGFEPPERGRQRRRRVPPDRRGRRPSREECAALDGIEEG